MSPVSPVWLLADTFKVGARNQAIGLLEALGLRYSCFSLSLSPVCRFILRWCCPLPWIKTTQTTLPLTPPWPRLVVAAGTVGTLAAAKIRRASKEPCIAIALQNPRMNLNAFDWVIAPVHDGLEGSNVLKTLGALHSITPERLAKETLKFQSAWAHLPHPLVTVLVGGPSRRLFFGKQEATDLAQDLRRLHARTGCGILLNCSRRTPERVRQILECLLKDLPVFFWDGEGESPYVAFLGSADYIIVTRDSTSMLSEAASTDKPIYVYPLPGKAPKVDIFHQQVYAQHIARPFEGELSYWARAPLLETQRIAQKLCKHLFV